MLILTRSVDEEIFIGPDIRLIVTQIRGDRVRIGVEAPEGVAIARGELLEPGRAPELAKKVGTRGPIRRRTP